MKKLIQFLSIDGMTKEQIKYFSDSVVRAKERDRQNAYTEKELYDPEILIDAFSILNVTTVWDHVPQIGSIISYGYLLSFKVVNVVYDMSETNLNNEVCMELEFLSNKKKKNKKNK